MSNVKSWRIRIWLGLGMLALAVAIGSLAGGAYAGAPARIPGGGAAQGVKSLAAMTGRIVNVDRPVVAPAGNNPFRAIITELPSYEVDMNRLGIRPTSRPVPFNNGGNSLIRGLNLIAPNGGAIGISNAYMSVSPDVVSQSTTSAIGTVSSGFTPAESVNYYLNGSLAGTFAADASGRLGVGISTGAGFGYITMQATGLTSGKSAGGVAQVLDLMPPVPGMAIAPHSTNHTTQGVITGTINLYGTRFPASTGVPLARDGVSLGSATTNANGRFYVQVTVPATTTDTAAVYSAMTSTVGSMSGNSEEERADAGTPPVGDQNLARGFVDRAVVSASATSGNFVTFVGEGFLPGETVSITCGGSPGSYPADANGAVAFFIGPLPAASGVYHCTYTGGTSGRVARGSIQAHANAGNVPTGINSPATIPTGAATFDFVLDRFRPNEGGSIYIDGAFVMTTTIDADGLGFETLPAPTAQGIHPVAFYNDAGDQVAIAPLFVGPPAVTSPTPTGTLPTSTPTNTATYTPTSTSTPTPVCPGSWTSQAVYPINIFDHGATGLGNFVYSFGGSDGTNRLSNAYKYDSGAGTWAPIASLPQGRQKPGVVSDGTLIYIVGGVDASGVLTTSLWSYNPATDSYNTALASFTTPVWAGSVAVLNGKIYKAGGCTTGSCTASTDVVEVYDIATNTWSNAAVLPEPVAWAASIGFNGKVYVAGSAVPADSNRAYAYDPGTNTWSSIANLPTTRWDGTSGIVNGKWMLAGGIAGPEISQTTVQYDPATNTWNVHDPMLQPRYRTAGGTAGGALYVTGGSLVAFTGTNDNQKFFDSCATPPSTILIGHVTYQGITQPGTRNNQPITVTLCVGGATQNFVQNTDTQGFFTVTLTTLNPSNTYNYRVKNYKNLANAGVGLAIPAGTTTSAEFGALKAGDSNNNNLVNSVDFNLLKNAFGTATNPFTDFNNDGITNSTDFNLQKGNFAVPGQNITCP